jgi:hypothetical protein
MDVFLRISPLIDYIRFNAFKKLGYLGDAVAVERLRDIAKLEISRIFYPVRIKKRKERPSAGVAATGQLPVH